MKEWLQVCGKDDIRLAAVLTERVQAKIADGGFTDQDVENIQARELRLVNGSLHLSDERLEKLRTMCQLWDIDIVPPEITSHRKFLGPAIVGMKKLIFPLIRVLLKDFVRKQRDFNAAAISLISDLANDKPKLH